MMREEDMEVSNEITRNIKNKINMMDSLLM